MTSCAKHSKPHLQIIMLVVNQKSTCGTNIQLTHTGGGRRETFNMDIWIMWNKSTPWACLDNTRTSGNQPTQNQTHPNNHSLTGFSHFIVHLYLVIYVLIIKFNFIAIWTSNFHPSGASTNSAAQNCVTQVLGHSEHPRDF